MNDSEYFEDWTTQKLMKVYRRLSTIIESGEYTFKQSMDFEEIKFILEERGTI